MAKIKVDKKLIEKIAKLAKLELTKTEVEKYAFFKFNPLYLINFLPTAAKVSIKCPENILFAT